MDRRHFSSRRNLQVLETIEDNSPFPSMLSPQDYAGRSGVFQSQKDTYLSPRLGISVSMRYSEVYSPGISLLELENKVLLRARLLWLFLEEKKIMIITFRNFHPQILKEKKIRI
jgi:hypothetical protein